MAKKIVALLGTYRKGGINDQAIDEILKVVEQNGGQTKKIFLLDKNIKFCVNCRSCTQNKNIALRDKCVLDDDLDEILTEIEAADGFILASPVNGGSATAILKRFTERLIVYSYWPWGDMMPPKSRSKDHSKKAIIISSMACPAPLARFFGGGNCHKALKHYAHGLHGKVTGAIKLGRAGVLEKQKLNDKQIKKLRKLGLKLV